MIPRGGVEYLRLSGLVDIGGAYLFWGRATARKCRRHVLNRNALTGADLRRMDAVRLGQLCSRHLLADR
ncbi:MAG: hypothetical protein ABJ214_16305, partial [Roseobacter sp.]